MKQSVFWKYDSELGWVYVCPNCKNVVYGGNCSKCGCEIDWTTEKQYKGKITWD